MLVINFNGNKPIGNNYRYSVQLNNNADVVRFVIVLGVEEGAIDFDNSNLYVKCQNVEDDYYDRVSVGSATYDEESDTFYVDFPLKAQQTNHKYLDLQLSVENTDEEVVWQTQIVRIAIANGIDADQQVADQYPSIIQQMLQDIEELKHSGGGSGGDHDVQIERVWLSYAPYTPLIVVNNVAEQNSDGVSVTNDASKIFVNFKTSPISALDEEEIRNGRFVIRFDYYVPAKPLIAYSQDDSRVIEKPKYYDGVKRINEKKGGAGYRSFRRNFFNADGTYNECLEKTILFIAPSDIKTNAYGEKYIHKVITYEQLINKFYTPYYSIPLFDKTFDAISSSGDDAANLFYLQGAWHGFGGVPISYTVNGKCQYFSSANDVRVTNAESGVKPVKSNRLQGSSWKSVRLTKLNPAFTIYAPFHCDYYDEKDRAYMTSPLTLQPRKRGSHSFSYAYDGTGRLSMDSYNHNKANRNVAVKPRCCIISLDYKTNSDNIWLKKYSQSTQNIRTFCKEVARLQADLVDVSYPIFRIVITKK